MRFKRATPSYRLICMVLAAVLLLALAVPGLAEHQWSDQIRSFERIDPVYDEAVELGTAQESLHLPDTLRAIVDIPEELDVTTFVQAAPEADTSDGSTSFDYYWYGYVAPQDADALVEAGEKAIYTIYYADGQLAYRLYGSIAGSENLWFACDEAGNITGAVLDIPVTWSGSYDGETAGTYTFTASVSAESPYHWSGSAPSAQIYVLAGSTEEEHEAEPVCTCGAQPGEDGVTVHAEDCPCFVAQEPVCTCGAQPGEDGVTVHAEDCPCFVAQEPVCTCGAQPGEDGVTVHAEDCPCFVAQEPVCTCGAQPGEDGVTVHAEDCPLYVVVLTDCHCGSDGEAIAADNFPWAHQEDCRYFSPVECMCRELVETEIEDYDGHTGEYLGTHTEYVPGDFSHVHDPSNRDCPLHGKDTTRVVKLDTGEETVMAVEDAERLAAYQTSHRTGDESAQETAMYPALGCISIIEGSEQAGEYDPELALYGTPRGINEENQRNIVRQNIPTSGNTQRFTDAPAGSGPWLDYVRTRFMNDYESQVGTWAVPVDLKFEAWGGGVSNTSSGSPATNKLKYPATNSSGYYEVYSAEQFRYAITLPPSQGIKIKLMSNMDLNGANYKWDGVNAGRKSITLDGNGHTIYNLGMILTNQSSGMIYNGSVTVSNLTVTNAKLVWNVSNGVTASGWNDTKLDKGAGFAGLFVSQYDAASSITKLLIENSTFAQTSPLPYASGGLGGIGHFPSVTIRQSGVVDCIIGGLGHPGALLSFADDANVSYSYTTGCRIYALRGAHGGILASCSSNPCTFTNCIASGEMYAQSDSGGFIGSPVRGGTITNCAATGKLEAYLGSGGFISSASVESSWQNETKITNCYTTVLVGLRSDTSRVGGFFDNLSQQLKKVTIKNCYAAGEVGDFSTNLSNPQNTGGFSAVFSSSKSALTNCYYDKQTTAMREWASGNQKTLPGVTGLLTSTSTKGGTGMASGSDFGLGTTDWTYTAGHYPQLNVFAKATAANWGGEAAASLVRAASSVSTATVFLNTWDEGYDWDNFGVRSSGKVDYNRDVAAGTLHKAGKYTYDTVREIISPFTVTDGTWGELIPGGAKTQMKAAALSSPATKNVVIKADNTGTVEDPGLNWFSVTNADPQGSGASLSRPLRLIGYMSIDAGNNRTVAESNAVEDGTRYDHRRGVTLTMMDEITDNLVVGPDNDKFWSTAKRAGYPTVSNDDPAWSTGFYGVPTDHTNHLATRFSASKDAILNTEIWRVEKDASGNYKKDSDGNYVTKYSVKVTGEGTSGGTSGAAPTQDERKWVGTDHFSVFEKQMYVVSYYWQLADGRYVTDSKLVEIVPSNRHLQVDVTGAGNLSSSTALQVDAYRGDTTTMVSTSPARSTHKQDGIPVAEPSTAVWKKVNPGTTLDQVTIQMEDNTGTSHGSATIDKETIRKVTTTNPAPIWVTVTYSYTTDVEQTGSTTQKYREETVETTAKVRYDLCMATDGSYYIQFNRSYARGAATPDGTVEPAASGGSLTGLKFEPMHYNVHVVVHVVENAYLKVQKVVSNYTAPMADQTFTIDLSGAAVSQVNLHHNETSKTIAVPITAASNDVTITERLPMEFSQQRITLKSTKGSAELNDNVLTLHVGDEVTVVVTNQYGGKGYFKSRTQANNTFTPAP